MGVLVKEGVVSYPKEEGEGVKANLTKGQMKNSRHPLYTRLRHETLGANTIVPMHTRLLLI